MASKQPAYKNMPMADDHDESSTEVDDSLIGDDEKQWHTIDLETRTRQRRRSTFSRVFWSYRWMIDTFLLLVIIALLLLLRHEWKEPASSSWQVGGDYTGAGPKLATKVVKWEADASFVPENSSEFFSSETLARWNTLMPAGTGWGSAGQTFFTTTMTHQLHCIFMMGRIYSGITNNVTERLPTDYHSHFLHCMDYLRQAAMCSADVALEAHTPSDSDDLGPLDGGWSGHHVCKDYNEVIHYLEGQIKDGVRTVLPIDD